jgi:hypothetical protein
MHRWRNWQTRHAQTVDVPSSSLGRCTSCETFAPMVQMVDAIALKATVMHVRLVLGAPSHLHARLAQLEEATALDAVRSEFESPGGYQFFVD